MSLSALLESLKASPRVEIVVIERDACVEIDTLQAEVAALREVAASQAAFINAARNILKRRVTTADVARTAAFLLSDASSRTTGAVIPVDGGVAGAFPR